MTPAEELENRAEIRRDGKRKFRKFVEAFAGKTSEGVRAFAEAVFMGRHINGLSGSPVFEDIKRNALISLLMDTADEMAAEELGE